MRFVVRYKIDRLELTYRMRIYSLVKEAIRKENPSYYEKLFLHSRHTIKPFSTSVYLKNFKIQGDEIELDEIAITISSPSMEFAILVFNGLRKLKEFKAGENVWKQTDIQILHEKAIATRKAILRTLSPILVEDKDGKPLEPNEPGYERELNYFANLQIKEFANRELYEQLRFTPIRLRKQVIKEKNRHLESTSMLFYTTYSGSFMLEGHPEDLQLLYQLGLGKRTSYFGLVDYEGEGV